MSEKKKNYIWFIILLLIVIIFFVIISKEDVSQQREEGAEIKVLEIDKEKKSEGEVTKESLENLVNRLKTKLEIPVE